LIHFFQSCFENDINYKREFKDDVIEIKNIKDSEEERIITYFLNAPVEEIDNNFHIIDDYVITSVKSENNCNIYTRYNFDLPPQQLPILAKRKEILESLQSNNVTIIQACVGSGKSTQIPQYILNDACSQNVYCNIIVTQPRRVSTEAVAMRVALERGCEIGSLVGFQYSQDRRMDNEETRLLYCTTGIFLQKLIAQKSLSKWTHVIIGNNF
jgi:ATP-dependent RNA helicase TDRD9